MRAEDFLESGNTKKKPSTTSVVDDFLEAGSVPPPAPEEVKGSPVPGNIAKGSYGTLQDMGRVYPAVEAAANLATMTYGLPASGAAGVVGGMKRKEDVDVMGMLTDPGFAGGISVPEHTMSYDSKRGAKAQEKVTETLIYQPQTKKGQELTETIFYPIEKLEGVASKVGDVVREKTGSDVLATAAYTGVMGAPMLIPGFKKAKGTLKKKVTVGTEKTVLERQKAPSKAESQFASEKFTERFLEGKEEVKTGSKKGLFDPEKPPRVPEFQKVTPRQSEGKGRAVDHKAPKVVVESVGRDTSTRPLKSPTKKDTTLYSGLPVTKMAEFWTKDIGSPIWDKGIQKGLPKVLEKIPGGKAVNRALIYDYRGNLPKTETYIKSLEDMKHFQSVGREYAIDLGKRLQSFDEATQIKMGEYISTKEPTVKLSGDALKSAQEAKQVMLDLGKQAVDAGLLSEKTFFKNAGQYMPRLYTSKEYQSLLTKFNVKKPQRLDLSRFKKRQDIPKEIREEMGEILTPGYPIAKGVAQLTHDIETARFFNGIARVKEWAIPKNVKNAVIPNDFVKLPSNSKLGKLSEAYVHPEIFKDLQQTIKVMEMPERVWRKALGSWKFGKVILSPKTHMRNMLSNSILAHLGGLPMYEQPVYLAKAAKAMKNKGQYWKDAKTEGLLSDTFTNAELRTLFDQVESQMGGIKANSIPERLGKIGGAWEKSKTGLNKAAKLYEAEEQIFKMAKYIHNVERKKMSPKMAAKDAEKWLFNYSKLTKFQESYRSKPWGAPFATFTFKAIPRIAEAMVKTPWRFALPGSIIYGLERAAQNLIGDSKEEIQAKKKLRPEWMQGSMLGMPNFARFPFVDEHGREYFLNLTYIVPWGDLGEGGDFGPIPGSLMPFSQPFVKEPWQQISNWDSFWKQNIIKESDVAGKSGKGKLVTKAKIRGKHLGQTMLPTPVLDVAKGISAMRGKPDYKGRLRPRGVVAADVFAGVKLYPVDYVERTAQEINKLDPKKGYLARKIKGEIKTLNIKANALEKVGKDNTTYKKQIEEKIAQLKGLAEETREVGSTFKVIKKKD